MAAKSITEVTSEIFALLNPFKPEERKRVINAVFVLFGDAVPGVEVRNTEKELAAPAGAEGGFGPKARQWALQHRLTKEKLEQVFYFHDGRVDIHLSTMLGVSKREQTVNCYLLTGARAFLESDAATFTDHDAITLCKHTQAYDKNNHTKNRSALGNYVAGNREDSYSLTGPGLKAAAETVLQISSAAKG